MNHMIQTWKPYSPLLRTYDTLRRIAEESPDPVERAKAVRYLDEFDVAAANAFYEIIHFFGREFSENQQSRPLSQYEVHQDHMIAKHTEQISH